MGKNKISLSFINDGKSFTVPHMTVKAQENLLDDIVKLEKKYKDKKILNREINKYMVKNILKTKDSSVTLDDIEQMHPDDYAVLIGMIMDGGRELTNEDGDRKFRTEKTTKKSGEE